MLGITTKSRTDEIQHLVATSPDTQRTGDALIDRFRTGILKRSGRSGFRGLVRILRQLDDNGDKKLNLEEFAGSMNDYGMEFRREDLERLFLLIDRDKSGQISVTEFIRAVRPQMPLARRDLVLVAYKLLDSNGDRQVTLAELAGLYDATGHPEVLAGRATVEDIIAEFAATWDKDGDKVITATEFTDYYTDISAGIDNDQYFELMIRNAWHISGGHGVAQNTTCMRVLVKFEDGRQGVVEVKNDLGLRRDDMIEIRKRLEKQGVKQIASIDIAGAV